jgi:hypothetical protein
MNPVISPRKLTREKLYRNVLANGKYTNPKEKNKMGTRNK